MQQNLGSLDVPKKTIADSGAFRRAFDQAGNVGHYKFAAFVPDDTELRAKRREGVSADLRFCIGNRIQQGRLARVRQAHETDVRKQLQP